MILFPKQYFSYNFFQLSISISIFYYFTKYVFKGSQLLHVLSAVWRCFKHSEKKYIFFELFWSKFKTTERYWYVLKNAKNDLWNEVNYLSLKFTDHEQTDKIFELIYWIEILRVPLIYNSCCVHSKFQIFRSSTCLCYSKFASNFLSDALEQLTTTIATNFPNSF